METPAKQRIRTLWDEIPGFGAPRADAALKHALTALMTLIDAQHAYWLGAVRLPNTGPCDPADGWRLRASRHLFPSPVRDALRKEHMRRVDAGDVDPSIAGLLQQAGRFRIRIRQELMGEDWFESDFYKEMIGPLGIRDAIFVVTPLGSDVESWFVFERMGEDAPFFAEPERSLLDEAVRPMQWFHRQLLLHHGVLLADTPLTPAERKVLSELLTEKTEPEIAGALHLAASTVHTYCTRICRKFNVRGRAGLIALWLGKMPEE